MFVSIHVRCVALLVRKQYDVHNIRTTTVLDVMMYCKERYMENGPFMVSALELFHHIFWALTVLIIYSAWCVRTQHVKIYTFKPYSHSSLLVHAHTHMGICNMYMTPHSDHFRRTAVQLARTI